MDRLFGVFSSLGEKQISSINVMQTRSAINRIKHTFVRTHGILWSVLLGHAAALAADLPVERILTDSKGRKLEVVVLEKNEAEIKVRRKSDGKEFSLELANVSREDQDFLKAYSTRKEPDFSLCNIEATGTPEVRKWKLESGEKLIAKAISVNETQEAVFIETPDGVTRIIRFAELSEEELDQAYLQDAGATLKPSAIHEFTLKGQALKARLMHIDHFGIILAPTKGSMIRNIKLEDLSKDDVKFVQTWYEQAKNPK